MTLHAVEGDDLPTTPLQLMKVIAPAPMELEEAHGRRDWFTLVLSRPLTYWERRIAYDQRSALTLTSVDNEVRVSTEKVMPVYQGGMRTPPALEVIVVLLRDLEARGQSLREGRHQRYAQLEERARAINELLEM